MYRISSRSSPDPTDRLVAIGGLSSRTNRKCSFPSNWCHNFLQVFRVSYRYSTDPTDRLMAKVAGSLARLILLLATVAIVTTHVEGKLPL